MSTHTVSPGRMVGAEGRTIRAHMVRSESHADRPAFAHADALVDAYAALSPSMGTFMGVAGHDHAWDDFGPEGAAARAALWRDSLVALDTLPPPSDRWEAHARDVMREHHGSALAAYACGDHLYDLNSLSSTFQVPRLVLEAMPSDTRAARENIVSRLHGLRGACRSYQALLAEGLGRGRVVGRRQVEAALAQGRTLLSASSSFARVGQRCVAADPRCADAVEAGVRSAREAYGELCGWLADTYLGDAGPDPVGETRYARAAARHLGMAIDLQEAYAWGWEEIRRIEAAMADLAARVRPDLSVEDTIEALRTDPDWCDATAEGFLARMRARQEDALARLQGVHFEVPEPARRIEVQQSPDASTLGAYYMQPSEDFSRPGSVWYALEAPTDISWFDEVSTAYHEGFPGHHLQIATVVAQRAQLSRFQRVAGGNTGYAEGWALYAEQLMHELGFLEAPQLVLGMYVGQLARAWRVVVDIGLHLEWRIPPDCTFHPGARWTPDLAVEAMTRRAMLTPATARSEVVRYLGWPGQAITYKIGQRVILSLRDEARARLGSTFHAPTFHARLLEVGSVGLGHLQRILRAPAPLG